MTLLNKVTANTIYFSDSVHPVSTQSRHKWYNQGMSKEDFLTCVICNVNSEVVFKRSWPVQTNGVYMVGSLT